jgi:hypothetical protein
MSGRPVESHHAADGAHRGVGGREEREEEGGPLASYRAQLATLEMRCRILHAELEESRQLQRGAAAASGTAQVWRSQQTLVLASGMEK